MKFATALPVLGFLALSTAALAEQAPPPPAPDMAALHAKMCNNRYAEAVGKLASLEVRLELTAAQKSAFERWKNVKLNNVKAATAKCADAMPLGRDASITDLRQRQITHLEARLAALKAETPALEALVKVLSPEQQEVLKRAGIEAARERFGHMRPMMGRGAMHRMDMAQPPVK